MNNLQSSEKISFKFEGPTFIDATLLAGSLNYITQAYRDCMLAQYGSDADISINVCAFQEGSFDVILQSVVALAPLIASPETPQILECAKTFLEIIKLKHELKGAKPQKVETNSKTTRITNSQGDVSYHNCQVYNLYFNNPVIDKSLSEAFKTISDLPRPAISFASDKLNSPTITISQDSYPEMKTQIIDDSISEDTQHLEQYVTENLLLKSPDLLGNSKWAFVYRNKTIHASIEDPIFKQRVRQGNVKLYAGVRIPVKMKIDAFLNNNLEVIKYLYTIVEVLGEVIEPNCPEEQLTLDE